MKTCARCKKDKLIKEFFRRTRSLTGYTSHCKKCAKKYYSETKERYAKKRQDKKEIKFQYDREYREKNREIIRKRKREYERYKMATDPNYKLARQLRMRMRQAIKNNSKTGSAVKDLGCSIQELRTRLESMFYNDKHTNVAMTWDNYGYGPGKWQIDHIKALYLFDLSNREQFLESCHYTNLQPLWHDDHTKKTTVDISSQ